jgi:transposase-like protein
MSVQRRRYDSDFKRNAAQLTEEPGRSVKDVADNLGISKDLLYKWRRELQAKEKFAFPGNGREALTEQDKKIRDLEKRLKDAEMERDILKKAVAIFSRAPK